MRITNHPLRLVDTFPDSNAWEFSRQEWESEFKSSNVIIHCNGRNLYYPTHWGPLSVKCAFSGIEFYQKSRCKYAVSDNNFLLLNEGTSYSSYIDPGNEVESLTINFSREYQSDVKRVLSTANDKLIDQPDESANEFVLVEEKLYKHSPSVSPLIYKIRNLTKYFCENEEPINETLYCLLEALLRNNAQVIHEIRDIHAARLSTKKEIYRRLNEVRDYIDSCFNEDITLETLSKIALMSPFHLLRQFKMNYHVTPHQYLINQRLERARGYIIHSGSTLADICFITGFKDASSFSKLFKKDMVFRPKNIAKP